MENKFVTRRKVWHSDNHFDIEELRTDEDGNQVWAVIYCGNSTKGESKMFTRFMDMHSGGGQKEKFSHCYIEASEEEAKVIFYNRFGHNPERVTCTCCGDDYSITECENLEQATAYERNCQFGYFFVGSGKYAGEKAEYSKDLKTWCIKGKPVEGRYIEKQNSQKIEIRDECNTSPANKWGLYVTLEDYLNQDDVCVIYAKDIKDSERKGEIPAQGYVWVD